MTASPTYAVITPARDEATQLPRLAGSLAAQSVPPVAWIIVDNGSTDGTLEAARALAAEHPFVTVLSIPGETGQVRGGPVVRALHEGLDHLRSLPDYVAKVDADVSFEPDFFARLLGTFGRDPSLGMASGTCHEVQGGEWLPRYGTADSVWGAARVYRRECLECVLPLDERMGWDVIDVIKANLGGWRTAALLDLPFRHHRPEGVRDALPRNAWSARGRVAYYLDYRPSYLLARTAFRLRSERDAFAMVTAYVHSARRREPRCPDAAVVAHVRDQQRLRQLPLRVREALGRA